MEPSFDETLRALGLEIERFIYDVRATQDRTACDEAYTAHSQAAFELTIAKFEQRSAELMSMMLEYKKAQTVAARKACDYYEFACSLR